jgi:hypothetical protein
VGASPARTVVGLVGFACATVLVLAACAPSSSASPEPSTQPTRTEEPSPSATPEEVDDVLFTIAANVRDTKGERIGILMTAHAPVAHDDARVADLKDEFLASCASDAGGPTITEESMAQAGSALMRVDLTSTTKGKTFAAPLDLYLGSQFFAQTALGDGIIPPTGPYACHGDGIYAWGDSGTAHGIADFQSGDPVPDLDKWRYGHYGFTVPLASDTTIEACVITLTELGKSAGLEGIPGWDTSQAASGTSCGIGYFGE